MDHWIRNGCMSADTSITDQYISVLTSVTKLSICQALIGILKISDYSKMHTYKLLWGTVFPFNLNYAVLALPVLALSLFQSKAAALICAGMPRILCPLPSCQLRLLQHIPSAHRLSWLIDRPLSGHELHTSQSFDPLELWEWARNPISIEPLRQASRTADWRNFLLPERQFCSRGGGDADMILCRSGLAQLQSHTDIDCIFHLNKETVHRRHLQLLNRPILHNKWKESQGHVLHSVHQCFPKDSKFMMKVLES